MNLVEFHLLNFSFWIFAYVAEIFPVKLNLRNLIPPQKLIPLCRGWIPLGVWQINSKCKIQTWLQSINQSIFARLFKNVRSIIVWWSGHDFEFWIVSPTNRLKRTFFVLTTYFCFSYSKFHFHFTSRCHTAYPIFIYLNISRSFRNPSKFSLNL